nr:MAG TPA: hypothetical protein [Caudoviricetes sp.]
MNLSCRGVQRKRIDKAIRLQQLRLSFSFLHIDGFKFSSFFQYGKTNRF